MLVTNAPVSRLAAQTVPPTEYAPGEKTLLESLDDAFEKIWQEGDKGPSIGELVAEVEYQKRMRNMRPDIEGPY
jgi:hypothetical protein